MELIFSNGDCYMYKKEVDKETREEYYTCTGGIDMTCCGFGCPFKKTLEEQKAIEEALVDRFKKENIRIDYKSCITGETLYKGTRV